MATVLKMWRQNSSRGVRRVQASVGGYTHVPWPTAAKSVRLDAGAGRAALDLPGKSQAECGAGAMCAAHKWLGLRDRNSPICTLSQHGYGAGHGLRLSYSAGTKPLLYFVVIEWATRCFCCVGSSRALACNEKHSKACVTATAQFVP